MLFVMIEEPAAVGLPLRIALRTAGAEPELHLVSTSGMVITSVLPR